MKHPRKSAIRGKKLVEPPWFGRRLTEVNLQAKQLALNGVKPTLVDLREAVIPSRANIIRGRFIPELECRLLGANFEARKSSMVLWRECRRTMTKARWVAIAATRKIARRRSQQGELAAVECLQWIPASLRKENLLADGIRNRGAVEQKRDGRV